MTIVQFVPAGRSPAQAAPAGAGGQDPPAATGPAERPDLVSAQLAAHAEKRRIEVTDARSESTSTFVNPDGTITVDSYSGIRRVRRGDGWADVDPTLVLADGKVTPKVAKAGIVLSAGGKSAGDVATLVDGTREVAFGWPTALPAPELKGDTATYHDVSADTDLVVKVVATGYDVRIVARTPAAAQAALRLPMRLKGLTAAREASGELRLSAGGKVTARSPAPLMWDSHVDPKAKLPDHTHGVDAALEGTSAAPTLALKPDKGWLTDPARRYPVTIDPAATLADNLDTDVNNANPTTNYDTSDQLRVGNYLGAAVNRSFLSFDDSAIKGRHVTSAVLNLWQEGSATCTVEPTIVQGAGGMGAGTTWNTQPSSDGITWGTATFNNGGSCTGSGGTNIDITGLVDAWAHNGFPAPETLTIRAPSETDANQFKYFYSGDTPLAPHISTTYNSYPTTIAGRFTSPCSAQCGGTPPTVITNATSPTLSGYTTDDDGGTVRMDFEVWDSAGTTKITGGSTDFIVQNTQGSWTVPAGLLTNGTSYEWRSRAFDGTDYSTAWSSWIPFTIDTTAPSAPTALTSTAWPSGGWSGTTSGTVSWTSPGGDTASFLYGLDEPSPSTSTTGTASATLTPTAGLHTFYLRTVDKAGNLSPVVTYKFGVGTGALASPEPQSRAQRFVTLRGEAPSSQVSVAYHYRKGTDPSLPWLDVPTGAVTIQGTTSHPTWPVSRNSSGLFDNQVWSLPTTFGGNDGPVQVQACFATSGGTITCTAATTFQYTINAFSDTNATTKVGPGTLAPLTGDFAVSATDVSLPTYIGTLAVGRTLTTLTPPGATSTPAGVFGPGWTSNIPGPSSGSANRTLTDNTDSGGYVTLTSAEGAPAVYTRVGSGSYPYHYAGVADTAADGSTLTKDSATQFTLTEVDGTRTTWNTATVGGTTIWVDDRVMEPGNANTSTFTVDAQGRTTRILAPVPAGVTCTGTLGAGCRALTISYATSTTATADGGDPATWGDYTGRISSISMSLNGAAPVEVARYKFDTTGRLREEYDPRLDTAGGGHLATLYWYSAENRVQGYIPPGQETWNFNYDSYGRLISLTRARPGGAGNATQSIVYDIPLTGGSAPVDMSPAAVGTWGQQDLPFFVTAVFPASHVPSSPPGASDWPYADLTYMDANGREVNAASYGAGAWQVTTTEHDARGNVIRTLSAENRDQALSPTADTDPTVAALTDSAARAQLLDTDISWSSDGVVPVDSYGPKHRYVTNGGTRTSARLHTHTDYDQGAPGGGAIYHLPTTVTTSAYDGSADTDTRKVISGYEAKTGGDAATSGWTLRKPTVVTTWMGGSDPDVVRTSYYNLAGQPVEVHQPKANAAGTDAFTTVTSYFTPTGTGSCVNASWAGLACREAPAAQPTSGNPLPATTYTYNNLNEPLTAVETVNSTTRTTTTAYDTAGRKTSAGVAVSPAADGGATVPTATYGYSPDNGQPTTTTAGGITLTTGYDTWGLVTSQTDADGNTTSTGYDIDGQTSTVNDGKGVYTYTYDGSTEHRGVVTSLNVGAGSAPSTFTATYNGDGKVATETYPNGLVATSQYDNTASPTALTYAKSGTIWLGYSEIDNINGQGRIVGTPNQGIEYLYDPSGRLTLARDVRAASGAQTCTSRRYAYDLDSNRTAETSYPDAGTNAPGATCSTSTTPTYTLTHSYDQADRQTDSGYTYDLFGRTTTVSAADAGGTALTVGYAADDMVASETAGSTTRTYTLDPARRVRSWTQGSTTSTNHYTGDTADSPAWIADSSTTWTRNIHGIGGGLAALQDNTGTVTIQLANIHGDIVATAPDTTTASSTSSFQESNEFGKPYTPATAYPRYGWLGSQQRSHDTLSGVILMGARLYNPTTGRFLQTDPIPGGSDNPYDYAHQDPYNSFDLDGRFALVAGLVGFAVADWWNPAGWAVVGVVGAYVVYRVGKQIVFAKKSDNGRVEAAPPASSPFWKSLKVYKNSVRYNGKNGKARRYYQWDNLHGDVEVWDSKGNHLGSADPETGEIYKPGKGHKIRW
ncbi:DNRLRE domain-containing protein [Frankia canadensis]|uniref:DNRLRE domain-containing protein n=1 Tax=Frankia canadensis TaxID=1836972 RepID=UPI0024359E1C|nr:DNRLRE domain-containing protein [Frankia canadensis]